MWRPHATILHRLSLTNVYLNVKWTISAILSADGYNFVNPRRAGNYSNL